MATVEDLKKEYEEVKANIEEEVEDKWPRVKAVANNRFVIAGLSALGGFVIGKLI
jgi:hypothetical protein